MAARVVLTRAIVSEPLEDLRRKTSLWVHPEERPLARDEMLKAVADAEGLICMLSETIDEAVFDAAPRLRVVANYAVGTNNIDVEAATRRGIAVCNTPGVLTEATADLAWALLMAAARRVAEGDADLRRDRGFRGWEPMAYLGGDLVGKTLGIVGMGRIGQAVARRAVGFRMRILYSNRNKLAPEITGPLGAELASIEELLEQSDFVTLHCPLTNDTEHLIGAEAFRRMKPTAYLINTARGPVVDEAALVDALREGRIAGAGLDVYEREPEVHRGLFELRNVVLSPHTGSATHEARTAMARLAADAVLAVLAGEKPANCVNPDVFGPAEGD